MESCWGRPAMHYSKTNLHDQFIFKAPCGRTQIYVPLPCFPWLPFILWPILHSSLTFFIRPFHRAPFCIPASHSSSWPFTHSPFFAPHMVLCLPSFYVIFFSSDSFVPPKCLDLSLYHISILAEISYKFAGRNFLLPSCVYSSYFSLSLSSKIIT